MSAVVVMVASGRLGVTPVLRPKHSEAAGLMARGAQQGERRATIGPEGLSALGKCLEQ